MKIVRSGYPHKLYLNHVGMKITASEWCNMTSQVEKFRVTLRKKLESIFHLWNVWIQNHPYILRIFTIFSWIYRYVPWY